MSILAKGASEPMSILNEDIVDVKEEELETKEETQYKIIELDWDVVVDNKEYKVIIIEGLEHNFINNDLARTLGRTDVWMCPRNEEPNKNNIIPYGGVLGGVCWNLVSVKYNDIVEISDNENDSSHKVAIEKTRYCITRNGKYFTQVNSIADGEYLISQIQRIELFNVYDYENKIIGHKIYWNDQPATIANINNGELTIIADGIDYFNLPLYMRSSFNIDEDVKTNKIMSFINDQYIYWNRE